MTIEIREVFEAGLDAVIADNTLNRAGFVDAMQTVITTGLSNAEGNAWVDAVAVEYNLLGQNSSGTYTNWRNQHLLGGTKDEVMALFDQLTRLVTGLSEYAPIGQAIELFNLREERDNIDGAIARFDVLIAAEPAGAVGRIVKTEMRDSKARLRDRKQAVRAAIQALTGDPDS